MLLMPARSCSSKRSRLLAKLCQHRSDHWTKPWWSHWWVPCRYSWMAMVSPWMKPGTCQLMVFRSFLGQCPPTVLGMLLVWIMVPNTTSMKSSENQDAGTKLSRVDFLGSLILVITITTFLLPMELGGVMIPWTHPVIITLVGCLITCALIFVLVETRVAKEPILSLPLMTSWKVLLPNTVTFCQSAAQLGVRLLVSYNLTVLTLSR